MRVFTFILLISVIFLSCEKGETLYYPAKSLYINHENQVEEIDIDNDGVIDIRVGASISKTGGQFYYRAGIQGINGWEVASLIHYDSIYLAPTLNDPITYRKVEGFEYGELLTAALQFSSDYAYMYYSLYGNYHTVNPLIEFIGQQFYIALRKDNQYAWLQLSDFNGTDFIVKDYNLGIHAG